MNAPYLPGTEPPPRHPLSRHLPPLPGGILEAWLPAQAPSGAWVLFPFAEAPLLTLEAARLGYRVLAVSSNPVLAFLQEILAEPGEAALWRGVLAQLAATRVDGQRLEPYIQALYATPCPACGTRIPARAFLWRKNAAAPHARLLACPECGLEGLHRSVESDAEHLAALQRSYGLHSGRALQRVAPPGDPLRPQAEAALKAYLPRALTALFTLLNQAERLRLPPPQQKRLHALLLAACDRANTLWPHPAGTARPPRTLSAPPVFAEWNLWQALEEAAEAWSGPRRADLRLWPQMPPPAGGVCLYRGRLRQAAAELDGLRPAAVIAALPRPNAAFWKQSILWSGWLWGRIGHWKPLLRRYRYTWDWHAALLAEAWRTLVPALPPDTPILGLMGEDAPAFLRAALIGAESGGLRLEGLARRPHAGAQARWRARLSPPAAALPPDALQALARRGILRHLEARAEAAPWDALHAAALESLAEAGQLTALEPNSPERASKRLTAALRRPFTPLPEGLRYSPVQARSERSRCYWLAQPPRGALSLADRAEMAVVQALTRAPETPFHALEQAVCAALPGLLTPEQALVQAVLDSYAEERGEGYRLRAEDAPAKRRGDLKRIAAALEALGRRLGARVARGGAETAPAVRWQPAGEARPLVFHVIASALAGRVIRQAETDSAQRWIVLPGSRARLLTWKIRRDPALAEAIRAGGWNFLKFRHVRRLAAAQDLTWERVQARLQLDPFTEDGPQLPLW